MALTLGRRKMGLHSNMSCPRRLHVTHPSCPPQNPLRRSYQQTVTCSSHAQPKREVVVGIDLGTTNSAIAVRVCRAAWL